jgi:hypothetical protein
VVILQVGVEYHILFSSSLVTGTAIVWTSVRCASVVRFEESAGTEVEDNEGFRSEGSSEEKAMVVLLSLRKLPGLRFNPRDGDGFHGRCDAGGMVGLNSWGLAEKNDSRR